MFNVKKTIPRLAAGAMLALTGCSTSDGDPGISANLNRLLNAYCMTAWDCFIGYDDQADCVNTMIERYGLGAGISSACEAAAISYFDCADTLTCDQLRADPNDCDDEWTNLYYTDVCR